VTACRYHVASALTVRRILAGSHSILPGERITGRGSLPSRPDKRMGEAQASDFTTDPRFFVLSLTVVSSLVF
jgi:hypothetical protein